jgi:hypothetical protein
MKTQLLLSIIFCSGASLAQNIPTKEVQIATAVLASPEGLREKAWCTVIPTKVNLLYCEKAKMKWSAWRMILINPA